MKLKEILALLLTLAILLSGCTNRNLSDIPSIPPSENAIGETSDPMKMPDPSQQAPASVSYGASFGADDIDLSGESMKISPTLKGGASPTNAGFVVFIDGIPQVYSSDNSTDPSYITGFDIEGNSEKTHDLIVRAKLDKTLEEHYISVGSMLVPEYIPALDTPYFGNYHRMLSIPSKTLPNEITSVSESVSVDSLSASNSVLSKEDREKLSLGGEDESGYSIGVALLQSDNRLERNYTVKAGETSVALKLYVYSTMPEVSEYRVSIFVNHIPVKINGVYDCVDVMMEGGKISKIDVIIDNIKQGDFIYCIAAPLEEGNVLYKSDSKMILNETSSGGNSSDPKVIDSSVDTNDISHASQDPDISGNNNEHTFGIGYNVIEDTNVRISPLFSIDENLFALIRNEEEMLLCKIDSRGEITEVLEGCTNASLHNGKIAVSDSDFYSFSNGEITFNPDGRIYLQLLDEKFNVIRSVEIKEQYELIDFDENRIVYVSNNNEIRCCDWNLSNEKTLFSLLNSIEGAEYFVDLKLCEGFVAFNAQGKVKGADADYYGICDFSGNYEIYRKDGIDHPQACGGTVLWSDRHVDVINGQMPSGEIVMYRNGKFTKIKPENSLESQDVFLTGENEFFTCCEGYGILKQYQNGKKIDEIPLGESNGAAAVIRVGDIIVVYIIDDSGRNLKCWELSQ